MKTLVRLMIAGAVVLSFAQSGYTQMSPPAATAAPRATPDDMARKAKANACSAKADAQGLYCRTCDAQGLHCKVCTTCKECKAREEFREKCKKS